MGAENGNDSSDINGHRYAYCIIANKKPPKKPTILQIDEERNGKKTRRGNSGYKFSLCTNKPHLIVMLEKCSLKIAFPSIILASSWIFTSAQPINTAMLHI